MVINVAKPRPLCYCAASDRSDKPHPSGCGGEALASDTQDKSLFESCELELVIDVLNGVSLGTDLDRHRIFLAFEIDDAIEILHVDKRWAIDAQQLQRKIGLLDKWEMAALLKVIEEFWGNARRRSLEALQLGAGLVAGPMGTTPLPLPSGAPCWNCRVRDAHKEARKNGWAKFEGTPREIVRATELRSSWMGSYKGEDVVWPPFEREQLHPAMRGAIYHHLRSVSEPALWIGEKYLGRPPDVEMAAVRGASREHAIALLMHEDAWVRQEAMFRVAELRAPKEEGGSQVP